VDGRVKVVDGWKRERARSRLRGFTVLIPSPESGRVDLVAGRISIRVTVTTTGMIFPCA
jgi:hypothetical protein